MLDEILNNPFVVGTKQTLKSISRNNAKTVFLAKDVNPYMTQKIQSLCRENDVPIIYVESMEYLGQKCKIKRDAACACILKEN